MSERLNGKLAFVTAAGQGIGFAIAEAFLLEGASVIATDLSADKLKNLKTDKIFALDVRSTEKTPDITWWPRMSFLQASHLLIVSWPHLLQNFSDFSGYDSRLDVTT